jgi:hypothetical protein
MFRIHMLDAGHGDCLWVEFGEDDAAPPKRILIDCGTLGTYRDHLKRKIADTVAEEGSVVFELFVVTHVDDDHIGGALRFLDDASQPDNGVEIREIWFNGFGHLDNKPRMLGGKQGEQLGELIDSGGWAWNEAFGTRAVMVPDDGPLPVVDVAGLRITLLSPDFAKLQKLKDKWEEEVEAAGLTPGQAFRDAPAVLPDGWLGDTDTGDVDEMARAGFSQDATEANGSSIAFLAEYAGVRVLFAADAHPSVLLDSAARAPLADDDLELDAFKLPHHGSRKNVSTPLLERFPARNYLVSTNGKRFKHPDATAISRVVVAAAGRKPCLHFNCPSDFNADWEDRARQRKHKYTTVYGEDSVGLVVEL